MPQSDFQSGSIREAIQFASQATPEQIESEIDNMTLEQISSVIVHINETHDSHWRGKTRAAMLGLNKRDKLENVGKALSLAQAVELFDKTLQVEDKHHWKLSPLLVGMPPEMFSDILSQASASQLHLLQHEGATEPVQHQLTRLSHQMTAKILEISQEIDLFHEEMETLQVDALSREDVLETIHRIDTYGEFFQRLFAQSNKALAIAWNTKRLDLIESFNKIKDSCQKYQIYGIGSPRTASSPPHGLYAKLEEKLFGIYGNPNNPQDVDAVRNDEPALEALVKLSVWYLRDYWNMGLLPSIKNREELDLNLETHSELERTQYREALFSQVKENLEKIGLSTVQDLKDAYIFSQKSLQEYIQQRQR
ncbi:MAG: hypothetical protein WB791_02580 [Waddliaceae bacterium]